MAAQFPAVVAAPDDIGVLYDELASKMEAFLNNTVSIPQLQVSCEFFPVLCNIV